MESTKGESKPKSKLKALLLLIIIVVAAAVGAFYYVSTIKPPTPPAPTQFRLSVAPSFIHISAGWGKNLTVTIARAPNFTGDIQVFVFGPSWILFSPLVIHAPATNGTLYVMAQNNAPNGTLDFQVSAAAVGSATQTAVVSMTVTGVVNVSTQLGTAEVFDTTKVLDNATMAALTSFDNSTGVIQFSSVTPTLQGLQRGDTIVGPPSISPAAVSGFLALILNVQVANGGVTLQTGQASLFDIFRTAQIGLTPTPSSGNSTGSSTTSLGVESLSPECSGFSCATGYNTIIPTFTWNPSYSPPGGVVSVGAKLTFGLKEYFGIDMKQGTEDVCLGSAVLTGLPPLALACVFIASKNSQVRYFQLSFFPTESMDVYLTGKTGSQFSTPPIHILPIVPGLVIPIFPPFLWLDLSINIDLSGTWHFTQAPEIEWTQQLDNVQFGLCYADQNYASRGSCSNPYNSQNGRTGWNSLDQGHSSGSFVKKGFGVNDGFTIKIGPTVKVDLDKIIASISGSLSVFLTFGGIQVSPPKITYPTDNSKIDLTHLGFGGLQWTATATVPQGAQLSCSWSDDKLGQIGASTGNDCNMDSYDLDGLVNQIITLGASVSHHITVTATWTGITGASVDVGLSYSGNLKVGDFTFGGVNLLTIWKYTIPDTTLFSIPLESQGGPEGSTTQLTSNPISVTFIVPTPTVQITGTTPTPIYAGQPFTVTGSATLETVNGAEDLCQPTPSSSIGWIVYVSSNALVATPPIAETSGTCTPSFTISSTGSYTITMFIENSAGTGMAVDNNGNPIENSATVNVVAAPASPPPTVKITIPSTGETSSSQPHTPTTPPVQLQGVVSGGTPPYTTAWTAAFCGVSCVHGPQGAPYTITLKYSTYFIPGQPAIGTWDLQGFCTSNPSAMGLVQVTFTATDSKNEQSSASTTINVNCQVIGEINAPFSRLPGDSAPSSVKVNALDLPSTVAQARGHVALPIAQHDEPTGELPATYWLSGPGNQLQVINKDCW
jgi:hypothetical protein